MSQQNITKFQELLESTKKILVIQADNPDADSLGSALALEEILSNLDKDVYLYCGIDIPQYLHHMEGWSRVMNILPSQFDASIIVDTSMTCGSCLKSHDDERKYPPAGFCR